MLPDVSVLALVGGLRASGRRAALHLAVAALTPIAFLLVLPLLEAPPFLTLVPVAFALFVVTLAIAAWALAARLRAWHHAHALSVAALVLLLVALGAALPLFIPFSA